MAGSSSVSLTVCGREVAVNTDGCAVDDLSFCGAVTVTVPAEVVWDELVAVAVEQEWVGVEALSGVLGTVGEVVARSATAYGQRVADTVASVRTWDHDVDRQRTFAAADCGFDSTGSRLSRSDRLEVLDVAFLLRQGDLTAPIHDDRLAALLDCPHGARVRLTEARTAILSACG